MQKASRRHAFSLNSWTKGEIPYLPLKSGYLKTRFFSELQRKLMFPLKFGCLSIPSWLLFFWTFAFTFRGGLCNSKQPNRAPRFQSPSDERRGGWKVFPCPRSQELPSTAALCCSDRVRAQRPCSEYFRVTFLLLMQLFYAHIGSKTVISFSSSIYFVLCFS